MNNKTPTLDEYLDACIAALPDDNTLPKPKAHLFALLGALGGLLIGAAPIAQSHQDKLEQEAFAYEHRLVIEAIELAPQGPDLYQATAPLFFQDVPPPFID